MNRKFSILTYGCQMNENDSEWISGILQGEGYDPAEDLSQADLILVNTCSIRDKAEQKIFSKLGQLAGLKKKNPALQIGVCGCVAQRMGDQIVRRAPAVDLVFGTQNISKLPDLLGRLAERVGSVVDIEPVPFDWGADTPVIRQNKIKAFVTVSVGCNKNCSFCVVPLTRGREISKPREVILKEVRALAREGYQEVTLLGQNVNSYGRDLSKNPTFPGLLRAVAAVEGIARVRFTTSHPRDLSPGLIEVMASEPKVCEYFHLPIQSGSDRVLKRMYRGYTAKSYMEKARALRKAVPHVALTTDIITGFPGEMEEDHRETLKVLAEVEFDNIFLFKYSVRPGTPAAEFGDQVSEEVKSRRFAEIRTLQEEITARKHRSLKGTVQEVLVEGPSPKELGKLTGRTRTNKIVNFFGPLRLVGHLIPIEITGSGLYSLEGKAA
ncbi:MAG: tRNA (N6-isopentenyl adenosine(37)-C2)-methylthiotransferase MiaB [Candidatus Tectomicrobia bacterium]|nr:tRNA (N6-isopentenyl adenosine(37)-C2)-methylthiotransferase MiaB [Candidatus Tectomicrobia bacterium]